MCGSVFYYISVGFILFFNLPIDNIYRKIRRFCAAAEKAVGFTFYTLVLLILWFARQVHPKALDCPLVNRRKNNGRVNLAAAQF